VSSEVSATYHLLRLDYAHVHRSSQAVGLESTTATRGAFLIQTSALFTPLIAGLTGSEVSATVWLATLLGAGGTALFTASSHPVADAVQQMTPQFGGGSVALGRRLTRVAT
jgi:drug/metabolite transporter (DMT)-like permease